MLVLLDAVHDRIINGEYKTLGKRSPVWSDGTQLFEGECNRWLVNGIADRFSSKNTAITNVVSSVNIAVQYEIPAGWLKSDASDINTFTAPEKDTSVEVHIWTIADGKAVRFQRHINTLNVTHASGYITDK
jgi:hypothetical protein